MYPSSIVSISYKKVFIFILIQISFQVYINNILKQFLKIYEYITINYIYTYKIIYIYIINSYN